MVEVRNMKFPIMLKWRAISIVILALLSIWILNPFYTVDAGERAVVTWFGEISGTENPGFHIKIQDFISRFPLPMASISIMSERKRWMLMLRAPPAICRRFTLRSL